MRHFVSLELSRVAELPLRPLLYAAAAAASAAGVYYYLNNHGDGVRTTLDPADTTPTEDPVQMDSAESDLVEPDLMCDVDEGSVTQTDSTVTQTDSTASEVTLSEAEEKYELESCARLENEKPELLSDVNALQDSVQELKKELSEARKRNDELEMECNKKSQELQLLQIQHNAIKTHLRKECEEEQQAHSDLKSQYNQSMKTLTQTEVSLAEVEEKNVCERYSNDEIVDHMLELRGKIYHDHKREQMRLESEREILQSQYKEIFQQCDELLMDCKREREAHNILKSQYDHLQCWESEREILQSQYKEIFQQCDELLMECVREREAHNILKSQYDNVIETLTHNEELLKNFQISLDEAEEIYWPAMEFSTQLESNLSPAVGGRALEDTQSVTR
ncbi:protein Hook homolog 1-like isoform X1 [Ictalurus furcatus]|uniref:protein Hook homolog 1-like isoform X1 n=1 Tax=Ictalurus furcatus TaxID=66913 RepID=UPI00234FF597|nr:protein Hook homolog 1-like isoform X1 [Ictalurus furcatus]XP_053509040.1 protein Hook homolog 1-like isoform X1 [Ictalurus furcatus]